MIIARLCDHKTLFSYFKGAAIHSSATAFENKRICAKTLSAYGNDLRLLPARGQPSVSKRSAEQVQELLLGPDTPCSPYGKHA